MNTENPVTRIIRRAGGARALAKACGIQPTKNGWTAVRNWHRIGIPVDYWPAVVGACSDVTFADLLAASLYVRQRAANRSNKDDHSQRTDC